MARTTAPKPAPAPMAGTNYPVLKGPKIVKAVEDYLSLGTRIKQLEDERDLARGYILEEMGAAPVVFVGARTVTRSEIRELLAIPERTITRDMVGQTIAGKRGRKGYVKLDVQ